ncbi:uncharacterized protein G2W53_041131 [Senna tora]|uniref:Uncharacterized protein n=1 Tax=Senna tora TaxID=362788 RepID=A0A834SGK8_9FABA|nr:uncharacterized protein G2W53_041131 [Senna tora]
MKVYNRKGKGQKAAGARKHLWKESLASRRARISGVNSFMFLLLLERMRVPEDWIASESARQAAMDRLPLSICSEQKSFSRMGQKTFSNESMESSAAGSVPTDMARWLNTVPILKSKGSQ